MHTTCNLEQNIHVFVWKREGERALGDMGLIGRIICIKVDLQETECGFD
jgi:hypothetical protein